MNDNAKAWAEALRSGEYQQGRHALTVVDTTGCRDERDCCLGVACKLAVNAGVIEPAEEVGGQLVYNDSGRAESGILPEPVRAWLGLMTRDSTFVGESGLDDQLSSLNDGGASFERIATIIESEPEGLFE
jgi:hypothetical protein